MSETKLRQSNTMYIGILDDLLGIGKVGDIGIYNDRAYICMGKYWERLEGTDNESKKMKPRFCQCCGAALHGSICEYCGVEYE